MDESRSPAGEFWRLSLALIASPLAAVAWNAASGGMLLNGLHFIGKPLDLPDQQLLRLFSYDATSAVMFAYLVAGLAVYPAVIMLRARDWLSFRAVLSSAFLLPLAGAATIALLFWKLSGATTEADMLAMFAFLSYLIVPGPVVNAGAFWWLYTRLPGGRLSLTGAAEVTSTPAALQQPGDTGKPFHVKPGNTHEQAAPHIEVPAILISWVLALGVLIVILALDLLAMAVAAGMLGLADDPNDRGQFLVPLCGVACIGVWFALLPAAIGLRTRRKLSLWTIVPPATLLPISTAAALALFAWSMGAPQPFLWFFTVASILVPGVFGVSLGFWALYCFFTGHPFVWPVPPECER